MQQKAQTVVNNVKKPNKINDVDEIGGNEINRVSDVNGGIDDLQFNDDSVKQGELIFRFYVPNSPYQNQ